MRIVFIGSAPLACACLDAILRAGRDTVVAVVSQPDRPKGRHLKPTPCPVKELAEQSGLQVLTPQNVNAAETLETMRSFAPDLIAVVAYGQILKSALLDLPRLGCVNIHASLLPRYRGAAPIQWAVANGESETGVTSIFMNERMDAGDIILSEKTPIYAEDTASSLHDRIAGLAGEVLLKTLDAIRDGSARRMPQDEQNATMAPKLRKADGRIDWTRPALEIHNRTRGFGAWPGSFCICPRGKDRMLRVLRAEVEKLPADCAETSAPGEVVDLGRTGPLVSTGKDGLRLLEVQPAGGRTMDGNAYLCGHELEVGDRFE